jgi:hypothetical protein
MKDFRTSAKQIEEMYNKLEKSKWIKFIGYGFKTLTTGKLYELVDEYEDTYIIKNDYGNLFEIGFCYFEIYNNKKEELISIEAKKRAAELMMLKDGYKPKDSIVESVISQFKKRSEVGIAKYGVTLDRTDLSTLDWINHAQQEAMDFCLYLEKLKQEFTPGKFGLKEIKETWKP